ncbi:MAG TPA: oligosaccharide flippase family protein [Ornithinibacter sp.]|nr:oligosaccharide flippase family protein [Ornithinibacter sp.]
MTTPPTGRRAAARLLRHAPTAAVLAAATLCANVLAYTLYLVLNRALTPQDLGAVAALLNLTVISAVLALALQLVAARHVATDRAVAHSRDATEAAAVATGTVLGLAVTGLMLLASPVIAVAFDLDGLLPAVLVAVGVLPTYLTFAAQGCLLGRERFGALGIVYVLVAGGRFLAGAGAAWAGLGVSGVIGATVVAAWVTAAISLAMVPAAVRGAGARLRSTWVRTVLHSATATSALLVVTNMDIPLARTVLPPVESGEYAVVSLFAKAAYWGPAFLATLFYPRMARATTRRSALLAVGSTTVIALVGVGLSALLAEPLIRIVGGPTYVGLAPLVPLLTASGAAWSVAQVLVYWRLSRGDHRLGYAVWAVAALIAATVLLWRHDSIAEIASTVLAGGLAVAVYGLVLLLGTSPGRPAPAPADPYVVDL